jgi:type I restriction enzyme S subunit
MADANAWTLAKGDAVEHVDYVEISEVMRGEVFEVSRYERGGEPGRARRRLRHGDTVLSCVRPDRGAHFLCLDPSPSLIASTGFAVMTPKDGRWAFLYSALTQPEVGEELGRMADGGAYPAIRPEVIASLRVAVPFDARILDAFERIVQPLYRRADLNRRQSRTLAEIRDALLPRLMSGELRVRDAEKAVEVAI